ncbi:hypothetical protein LINGRAHAP2_LOCUS7758 [Linum grandiflorum]
MLTISDLFSGILDAVYYISVRGEVENFDSQAREIQSPVSEILELSTSQLDIKRKLKLWSPNLEKFDLQAPTGLEEIELDCGPRFSNFILRFNDESAAYILTKCEIRNAGADLIRLI